MIKNHRERGSTFCGSLSGRIRWFAMFILMAAFCITSAQSVWAVGSGSITGTITGPSGPVSGTYVAAVNAVTGAYAGGSAASAADGSYTISALATGTYKLFNNNNSTATGLTRQWYQDSYDYNTARPVAVIDGSTTSGINFALTSAGTMTGTVVRASDLTALSGLVVNAYALNPDGTTVGWAYNATTSGSGTYSIPGLPPGKYKVAVNPGSTTYALQYYSLKDSPVTAQHVTISAGSTTSGINFSLVTGGKISGTIRGADTLSALSGAAVVMFSEDMQAQFPFSATTAADGSYTTCGLPAGTYRILAFNNVNTDYAVTWYGNTILNMASSTITVSAGATESGKDINMAYGAGKITGTVTRASDGQPVAGMLVRLLSSGPLGQQMRNGTTGWDGSYTIIGIAPGAYRLYAQPVTTNLAGVYYNNASTQNTASLLNISTLETKSNVNFSLPPGGSISGVVTGAGDLTPPLPGMLVRASEASGSSNVGYYFLTQYDGSYTITGLPAGTYFVRAYAPTTDPSNNYIALYYNNVAQRNSATGVAVVSNETTPTINFSMPLDGKVSGTVTSAADGSPIPGLAILAFDTTSGSQMAAVAATIRDGSYTLTGLPAGSYYIRAYAAGTSYASGYYSTTGTVLDIASATSVSVSGGTVTGITMQLPSYELLYADFTGNGIWKWNSASWSQVNPGETAKMAASGSNLYANFSGYGLWQWNGTAWSQINPGLAANMTASGSNLYVDFAGYGIWVWNGTTWIQINPGNSTGMTASGSNVYANFSGYGLWQWNGSTWRQINPGEGTGMTASGSNLYANFAGYGIWQWNGSTWGQINPTEATVMTASGGNLYANFAGYGIWQWNGTGWSQLNPTETSRMTASGNNLYANFAGYGLWKWNGSAWSQINTAEAAVMVGAE